MAFEHGRKARLLMDQYDLSGFLTDISTPRSVDTAETSTFTQTAKTYVLGMGDGTLSASGVFDGASGAVDQILDTTIGNEAGQVFTFGPQGYSAVGQRAKLLLGKQTAYEISGSTTDAVRLSLESQADGGIDGGHWLHEFAAETATGDYASVDNGAASTNGGVGHLHVSAYATFTSVTIKIEDSADDAAFADLGTFFVAVTAVGVQRIALAVGSTVRRYVRAQIEAVGGAGSITFAVSFARR